MQNNGSLVALFNLFVQIARDQLHIVVAMSPIGDSDSEIESRNFQLFLITVLSIEFR